MKTILNKIGAAVLGILALTACQDRDLLSLVQCNLAVLMYHRYQEQQVVRIVTTIPSRGLKAVKMPSCRWLFIRMEPRCKV